MWITVLVLALAMNFEPSRPVWVPLMLVRPRPILQLVALFLGSFLSGLALGLLVLFVFHQTPFGNNTTNAALMQIGVGLFSLVIAAFLASNISMPRRRALNSDPADEQGTPSAIDKMSDRARKVLRRGNSPWLSAAIGVGIGAPSLEYVAALVVIAGSGASKPTEIAALLVFLLLGNLLIVVPLLTYLFAPTKTRGWIERFHNWLRTRGRREFATIVAALGLVQLIIGLVRL
ncbi:MAG: GAP family protein [Mycobacterium sp.]|nr:GAP family protein [Mycobacterium sp.]